MITILTGSLLFSSGFLCGSYLKSAAWENEDWKLLKWDGKIMGYRLLTAGSKMRRGENIVMCLKVDTEGLPEDGIVNEL